MNRDRGSAAVHQSTKHSGDCPGCSWTVRPESRSWDASWSYQTLPGPWTCSCSFTSQGGGTRKQPGLSASQNQENLTLGQQNEAAFLSPSQVRHDYLLRMDWMPFNSQELDSSLALNKFSCFIYAQDWQPNPPKSLVSLLRNVFEGQNSLFFKN